MTAQADPVVRLEIIAAAAGLSLNSLRRARRAGLIPPPDVIIRRAHAWRLSTVNAWNPTVAERCSRMMVDRAMSEQRP